MFAWKLFQALPQQRLRESSLRPSIRRDGVPCIDWMFFPPTFPLKPLAVSAGAFWNPQSRNPSTLKSWMRCWTGPGSGLLRRPLRHPSVSSSARSAKSLMLLPYWRTLPSLALGAPQAAPVARIAASIREMKAKLGVTDTQLGCARLRAEEKVGFFRRQQLCRTTSMQTAIKSDSSRYGFPENLQVMGVHQSTLL